MRAVNLIPAEQRRGAGGIAGRSGGIVYVLTGGLTVLVLLGVVYALAVHSVADKKGQLASLTEQVTATQAQAQVLQPYIAVAALSQSSTGQVVALAKSRFDWPNAMRQLALALPSDVTFISFTGATTERLPRWRPAPRRPRRVTAARASRSAGARRRSARSPTF